jgi:hypothetical protein
MLARSMVSSVNISGGHNKARVVNLGGPLKNTVNALQTSGYYLNPVCMELDRSEVEHDYCYTNTAVQVGIKIPYNWLPMLTLMSTNST